MVLRFLVPAVLLLAACGSAPRTPGPLQAPPGDLALVPLPLTLPYAEVEAETAFTNGRVPAANTDLHNPGSEASGRRYVALGPGERLELPVPRDGDSLVVRYSWPDLDHDGVLEAQVGDGAPLALPVTGRLVWEFGQPHWGGSDVWSDTSGEPRHFFDEVQARVPAYTAGTTLTLTNPAGSKSEVLVDLVDFEQVAPAVACPPGAVNFADWQPDPTGATDVTRLLQKAADKAKGGVLYLPEGTYRTDTIYLGAVEVQGAGLWRTKLVGPISQFRFGGKKAAVRDLAIFGTVSTRDDTNDEVNGLAGAPGPGSVVERVWIEHKKCAFWVGSWGAKTPVTGLTLADCRFRNLMADAVNLCSGTTDTEVRGCLVRSSGDDGLAAWSPKNGGSVGGNNRLKGNYVQLPWVASGIALYGGGPFLVEGNVVADTVTTGSGLYLSANFGAWPFQGTITVKDNLFVRAGAHESDPGGPTGALRLLAADGAMDGAEYRFVNNTVAAPLESAVSIHGPRALGLSVWEGLKIQDLPDQALTFDVRPGAAGRAEVKGLVVEGKNPGQVRNFAGTEYELVISP